MTGDWAPIRRVGEPSVTDIDPATGRAKLTFGLSDVPPREWRDHMEAFLHTSHQDGPRPQVNGLNIAVWSQASDDSFLAWADGIDRTIESANKVYLALLHNQGEEAKQPAEQEEVRKQKIADYDEMAKKLGGLPE
jgi:hypothetical protein